MRGSLQATMTRPSNVLGADRPSGSDDTPGWHDAFRTDAPSLASQFRQPARCTLPRPAASLDKAILLGRLMRYLQPRQESSWSCPPKRSQPPAEVNTGQSGRSCSALVNSSKVRSEWRAAARIIAQVTTRLAPSSALPITFPQSGLRGTEGRLMTCIALRTSHESTADCSFPCRAV
jgi:hypothetical protein